VALTFVVRARPRRGLERWLLWPFVGVWAGWASAATFANVSITAQWAEFGWWGLSQTGAAVLVILVAAAFGTLVLWMMRGDLGYAFALVWALVAIVVANTWERAFDPAVAIVAALGIVLVAATVVQAWKRRRRGDANGTAPPLTGTLTAAG
jgi:hypothetical protein